jgi:ribulose-phosphate 3-epimerase
MEIIPAIIPKNLEDLEEKLSLVRGISPVVQIDITDGVFVPEKSWPYGKSDVEKFEKIKKGEECIPFNQDFYFEGDLMIDKPEDNIEDFIFAGFNRLVIHLESTDKMDEIISKARELDIEIGIAINIDTPNEMLEEYIDRINFVQFMGIKKIGFQGQEFDEEVINKISLLRQRYSNIIISVDGGVSIKNAPYLLYAGADRLVSGSAIFESNDIFDAIGRFEELELKKITHD